MTKIYILRYQSLNLRFSIESNQYFKIGVIKILNISIT